MVATDEAKVLDCAVVGAGIAGLAAAIGLRKAGHRVELFEKSSFKNEVGAAMTATPNANRVLAHWNFDFEKAGSTEKLQYRRVDPLTLEMAAFRSFADVGERFGHHFNAYHRVDLHRELREMAESTIAPGSPVKISLGKGVQSLDCESGTIVLEDGTKVVRDLIVVANGVKTNLVESINGVDVPRKLTGSYIQRGLVEVDKLLANDQIRHLWEGQPSGFFMAMNMKAKTLIITYPCRSDKMMNLAIAHPGRESEEGKQSWNAPTELKDVESLVDEKLGFHPVWTEVVRSAGADGWKCFPASQHRDPLTQFTRGKAVIIGDAAHAMAPTHAQGGVMCIEDAGALEVLFSEFKTSDSVEKRLKLYNTLRLPRVATTQILSNAQMGYLSGQSVLEQIRSYFDGPVPTDVEPWSPRVQSFFWDYDVLSQAKEALKYEKTDPGQKLRYFGDMQVEI